LLEADQEAPGVGFVRRLRHTFVGFFSQRGPRASDVAIGIALVALVLTLALSVSGHLPARGLASGAVYSSHGPYTPLPYKPFSKGTLVFRQVDSSQVFQGATDAAGHYSVTLPPGRYRVLPYVWDAGCPFAIPECLNPPEVIVIAGENVTNYFVFPGLVP
jgi:hypothetical protein